MGREGYKSASSISGVSIGWTIGGVCGVSTVQFLVSYGVLVSFVLLQVNDLVLFLQKSASFIA